MGYSDFEKGKRTLGERLLDGPPIRDDYFFDNRNRVYQVLGFNDVLTLIPCEDLSLLVSDLELGLYSPVLKDRIDDKEAIPIGTKVEEAPPQDREYPVISQQKTI
jgi:hypothetical protein